MLAHFWIKNQCPKFYSEVLVNCNRKRLKKVNKVDDCDDDIDGDDDDYGDDDDDGDDDYVVDKKQRGWKYLIWIDLCC